MDKNRNEQILVTKLPAEFTQLEPNYYTLGQSLEFYVELKKLNTEIYISFLKSINDIVYSKLDYSFFENSDNGEMLKTIFNTSIIRNSEAEKAFREAPELFYENSNILKILNFGYNLNNLKLNFNFNKNKLPYRVNVIIGENGVGKTYHLSKLALAISGKDKTEKNNEQIGYFLEKRPSFAKIMTISYSIFDDFEVPEQNNKFDGSYMFFGAKKKQSEKDEKYEKEKDNLINIEQLKNSIELIKINKRIEKWETILKELLPIEKVIEIKNDYFETSNPTFINNLSSGQGIIVSILTNVIGHIVNESLILFDEPETHLHPNAISDLLSTLNTLLEEFNSFSIIATHSPIVLQEIPSRYVQILDRTETGFRVRKLNQECFGDNLNTISKEVFEMKSDNFNYQRRFDKLLKNMSADEIINEFGDQLNLNAKLYLKNFEK